MKEKNKKFRNNSFKINTWQKSKENNEGGVVIIMRNGSVFDSVGINFSEVSGKFSKKFKSKIPGANKNLILGFWYFSCSSYEESKNTLFTF